MRWATEVKLGVFLAEHTRGAPGDLTESDLSELLDALRAGELSECIRSSLEWTFNS